MWSVMATICDSSRRQRMKFLRGDEWTGRGVGREGRGRRTGGITGGGGGGGSGVWSMMFSIILSSLMLVGCGEQCPAPCQCSHDSLRMGPQANDTSDVSCIGLQLTTIPSLRWLTVFRLNLSWNHLTDLDGPSLLVGFAQLTSLNLSHNLIGSIAFGTFHPTPLLRSLDLSHNQLTTLDPGAFAGAHALVDLDLSGNRLSLVDGAFGALANLSSLDLSRNFLREITEFTFRDLARLRHLALSTNRIARLDGGAFHPLHSLLHLVLRANSLRQVASLSIDNAQRLSFLDLSECELTQVPRGLTLSLRYIQLRRNQLTAIRREDFEDSKNVNILVLDENQIESIESESFSHLHQLQQLWLNDNHLHALPHPLPASLRRLLIDSNQIDRLTIDSFANRSQLTTFSIVNNSLSHVTPDAFRKLTSLTTLDLSNNRLMRLHGDMFANNTQLQTLNLNQNPLRYFDCGCFEGLKQLRSLSLGYVYRESTLISIADPLLFSAMPRLTVLDLDNSPALSKTILQMDDVFRSLEKVQVLGLLGLDVTELRPDFPTVLKHLSVLRISSSRWHCNDRLLWFRTWLISTTVTIDQRQDNRCLTPRALHGRSIVQAPETAFAPSTDTAAITPQGTFRGPSTPTTAPKGPHRSCRGPANDSSQSTRFESSSESLDKKTKSLGSKQQLQNGSVVLATYDGKLPTLTTTWSSHPPGNSSVEGSNDPRVTDDGPRVAEKPSVLPSALDPKEEEDPLRDFRARIITAASTVLATIVIAGVILTLIIWLLRRRKTQAAKERKQELHGHTANRTVITYRNKDGVLYFSTAAAAAGGGGGGGGCGGEGGDGGCCVDDDDDDLSSKTTRCIYTQMMTFAVPEMTTGSPSKDIEGRRVYHWEEDGL